MSQNSNSNDNRVLVRRGARKVNDDEANQVTGGRLITLATALPTNLGKDTMLDQ